MHLPLATCFTCPFDMWTQFWSAPPVHVAIMSRESSPTPELSTRQIVPLYAVIGPGTPTDAMLRISLAAVV